MEPRKGENEQTTATSVVNGDEQRSARKATAHDRSGAGRSRLPLASVNWRLGRVRLRVLSRRGLPLAPSLKGPRILTRGQVAMRIALSPGELGRQWAGPPNVAAEAEAIVSHNVRDFVGVDRFGVRVMTPADLLKKIGKPR